MKEHPILFSPEMVKAILDGRKTETRRVLKPMSGKQSEWLTPFLLDKVPSVELGDSSPGVDDFGVQLFHPEGGPLGWVRSKYGKPGDRLWVKESCWLWGRWTKTREGGWHFLIKKPIVAFEKPELITFFGSDFDGWSFRSSIHMPRWAARIELEILAIGVERLQTINDFGATREGVEEPEYPIDPPSRLHCPKCWGNGVHGAFGKDYGVTEVDCFTCDTPKKCFSILWNNINGKKYPWDSNPWVWVIAFKKLGEKQ